MALPTDPKPMQKQCKTVFRTIYGELQEVVSKKQGAGNWLSVYIFREYSKF